MYYKEASSNIAGQANRAINTIVGYVAGSKAIKDVSGGGVTSPAASGNDSANEEIKRLASQNELLQNRINKLNQGIAEAHGMMTMLTKGGSK